MHASSHRAAALRVVPAAAPAPDAPLKLAAVLYTPRSAKRRVLHEFAREMQHRGWRVAGVLQQALDPSAGSRAGVDAIALDNGERFALTRPRPDNNNCSLDPDAFARTLAVMRRSIDAAPDLIVVEKFGEHEQRGAGMLPLLLEAVASGIPVLIAVPVAALDLWQERSGGLGELLAADPVALRRWWGPRNLLEELARGVAAVPAKKVITGLNWTLVEGPHGCGLAHTPARGSGGCRSLERAGELGEYTLRDLAALAQSWNPFEAALGVAAINAHYNRYDLQGEPGNGLDAAGTDGGVTVCIGRFPGVRERIADVQIIEMQPHSDEYPETATEAVLASADTVLVTSSALVNGSLPRILAACPRQTRLLLVGPGAPLAPCLGGYGVHGISGLVIENVAAIATQVGQGGSVRAIKRHGRYLTVYPARNS